MINWSDGGCKISKHFTVRHALWLPTWKRLALDTELDSDSKEALVNLFEKMDKVRDLLKTQVYVHCAFRPKDYNQLVGGAPKSAHMARKVMINGQEALVAACDFHAEMPNAQPGGPSCNLIRGILKPELEYLGMRMEDLPDSGWVHLDTRPVSHPMFRMFKP